MRHTLILLALAAAATAAPPEVAVIHPIQREVFDHVDFTGRIEAKESVEIRPRVTGYLDKIVFKEGSLVKKGDLLVQIDDRVQRAELAKAEADVRKAEAGLKLAEAEHARITRIVQQGGAGHEELDRAAAGVETAKAAVLAARATLEVAKLNLDFTRIASPIDGRIGRANVSAGNLVRETDVLATVQSVDPVYAAFDLDERTLLRFMHFRQERKDAKPTVGVALIDEKGFPRSAVLEFIDPAVDPKTGTVRVRALLSNPKEEMRPGQFARVRLPLGEPRKALLLPETLISAFGNGDYRILVVNEKNVIEDRPIRLGPKEDALYVIDDGLKATDRVVRDARHHKAGEEVRPQESKDRPDEEHQR